MHCCLAYPSLFCPLIECDWLSVDGGILAVYTHGKLISQIRSWDWMCAIDCSNTSPLCLLYLLHISSGLVHHLLHLWNCFHDTFLCCGGAVEVLLDISNKCLGSHNCSTMEVRKQLSRLNYHTLVNSCVLMESSNKRLGFDILEFDGHFIRGSWIM